MPGTSNRRLLAVLAHPDDESFGPGGTLALYAHQGAQVHLICATRGEVGAAPSDNLDGHTSVGDLREAELRCAAVHLGLSGVHFLGYRDSGMQGSPDNQHPKALARAPLPEVAARITHLVRQFKPQVLITFDPLGGYNHPDHVAVHRATVEAFHAAGDPNRFPGRLPVYRPQKLYYHTFSRRFLRLAVRLLPILGQDPTQWGRNGDINLIEIASQDFPIHARIDFRRVAEAKRLAAACHASQDGPPTRGFMGWLFRLTGGRETFTRAFPPVEGKLRERDLFAGVTADQAIPAEPTS
jgi:LmbE family N-acetylglucosaminyl deacetylase